MRRVSIAIVGSVVLGWLLLAGPAFAQDAQDLDRGEELFALCTQCHGENGGGNSMFLAPDIAGLPQWYVERQLNGFRDGLRGTHFDDIAGMRMRPMALTLRTDEDLAAVAAYVASLPPIDPDAELVAMGVAEDGAQYFALCGTCHGQQGEGNLQLNGPPLAGASDWYLQTQLMNFKAGIRGANPNDALGAQMRGMAATLPDDQAVLDVIAYIETLSPNDSPTD